MSSRFKIIAQECGREIGFDEPNVADDYYGLKIDSVVVIMQPTDLDPEGAGILLSAEVGEFMGPLPEKILSLLLGVNIGFEFTQGTTLGLSPKQNKLFISKICSPAIDSGEKLAEQVNAFVDTAEYWQKVVDELATYKESDTLIPPSMNMLQV